MRPSQYGSLPVGALEDAISHADHLERCVQAQAEDPRWVPVRELLDDEWLLGLCGNQRDIAAQQHARLKEIASMRETMIRDFADQLYALRGLIRQNFPVSASRGEDLTRLVRRRVEGLQHVYVRLNDTSQQGIALIAPLQQARHRAEDEQPDSE